MLFLFGLDNGRPDKTPATCHAVSISNEAYGSIFPSSMMSS
ncbi:hypothetical protein NC99_30140 [Sunxiuqinia dokdonensis]|uniref:Uncharacterized protein n=1 Tax=Sunxiuqinia dokdonensis TaxID=1409788 RepID=A0A0L8V794_9BACT|nr:hypothetical protein NC99_30140 [Sunxiuqinia dokdonensis]